MKMKKHTTTIIISFISITIIIISALLINTLLAPYYRPDKDKMEKYFKQDKDDIVLITDYFADYVSSIHFSNVEFKSKNYKSIINDEKVVDAIIRLFEKRGYSVMGKQGNTIYFQKWTRGADVGIGIAYSINKKDEPVLQFLTKLEALSENGWYFYEEDYNEWRR